jgi:hypothetical protein
MRAFITSRFQSETGSRRPTLGLLAICLLAASRTLAAPPDVKSLFPSGLQQGSTRTLKVNGKPGETPLQCWTSTDGLSVKPSESGEELTVTADAAAPTGLHWIRLYNADGASPLLPVIIGVLPETTESETGKEESAATVTLPVTISGVLSKSGEVDSFPMTMEQGQTLIASVESNRSLGAPADVVMQLVSADGFVIDQNDDYRGFDPQIVFSARQTGTFTVRLFAFPAVPNSTIRFAGGSDYAYRLTLTTGPFVDHTVPLSLPDGDATGVRQFGWNVPDSASSDSSPLPTAVRVLPPRRQPSSVVVEEPRLEVEAVQTISLGSALTGHIAKQGEVDAYAFQASKDQRLQLTVSARSYGSPLDPVVRVLDADGKLIKEADDISRENADTQLDLKIPAEGQYRVEVADRFGHGGMRYVYELQIEQQQPRFALTVKEDRYTLKEDKPVEIPVEIDRQGGFAEEVTVVVRGLPEEVKAEPVVSAAKGDSSKEVKLTLKAKAAAAFNGPIEVVGTGPDKSVAVATTPTPSASITTTNLWLTIVPAPEGADAPGDPTDP